MQLEYVIANPTGNITAIILTPAPETEQPRIAEALMAHESSVEQAGFLSLTSGGPALRMAGGEFCGNATMSAAAVYARARGLRPGEGLTVAVSVSGAPESVDVELAALPDGSFSATVNMPPPLSVGTERLAFGGRDYTLPLLRFPGIAHAVVSGGLDRPTAERAARLWCSQLGVPALGLMLLDEAKGALCPLVYVPAADTLFWESSCASGSAAVGAWASARDGAAVALTLSEPGGHLSVEADFAAGVLRLGGHVRLGERKMSEVREN